MDIQLIEKLTLIKEDLEMILDSDFDYDFVTDRNNINATLNNVNIALKIAKELKNKIDKLVRITDRFNP
jgi:hypothetical protein